MADEYTDNYGFFLPKDTDPMSDVKKNITDSFKIIEPVNDFTVIPHGTPLPQAGSYEVGDRVFKAAPNTSPPNYPSNYILLVKDTNWGWHWRPIQHKLSPWVTIPSTAIDPALAAKYFPDGTLKFEIALDSKGWCYWRGALRVVDNMIPNNTKYNIFRNIPRGIRPNQSFTSIRGTFPVNAVSATYMGVSMFLKTDGSSYFVGANTAVAASTTHIHLDGVRYQNSDSYYYGG